MVVAKKYIYVSQLFISRIPKMRAIPQYDTRGKNELRHHLSKNNSKPIQPVKPTKNSTRLIFMRFLRILFMR